MRAGHQEDCSDEEAVRLTELRTANRQRQEQEQQMRKQKQHKQRNLRDRRGGNRP